MNGFFPIWGLSMNSDSSQLDKAEKESPGRQIPIPQIFRSKTVFPNLTGARNKTELRDMQNWYRVLRNTSLIYKS